MNLLADAMSGLGAALLPVAAALLFEELTFGGLVRLLLAPWPGAGKHGARGGRSSQACGRKEHKHAPQTKDRFVGTREITTRGIRRREMIALKIMLMIAGVSLMAAAIVFPLYGLWMRIRYAHEEEGRRRRVVS